MVGSSVSLLLPLLSAAYALPTTTTNGKPAQALKERASACTPSAGGSESIDDVPAITSAIAECSSGTIVLPAETTYYANSVLDFDGCAGCDFQIEGTLKFTGSTDFWNGETAMMNIKNIDGIKIRSTTGSGVIDGNGQESWDLFAQDESYARPTLVYITGGSDIQVSNLAQKNPPNVFNSVKGGSTNVVFSDLNMTAKSTSDSEPKNTDGFDIGESTYVTLTNIDVVNDDDCVAFKPSANYVTVDTITCTGSHGISVGSLGKGSDDSVKNIYVTNAKMIDSSKAAGIKTYPSGNDHGVSTVSNVTFTDFTVDNSDYAFQIQSCYGEDDSYCESNPGDAKLSDIVIKSFSGTTSDKYDPTTANINCGSGGTCGVTISDWTVKASSGSGEILCANTPSDLGVECKTGASG
ncbi:endo-xylogalacturonan hydrolase A [Phyllosticta citrichinensis]|uniref:Endo-xylogalacturonan hydrolase A n=1 Tax=Phyllosticta citrichinensis TaxID=1130410 RepID=A0ABR1XLN7_9PEZI